MTDSRRRDGWYWKNGRIRYESSLPPGQRVPGVIETAVTFVRGEPFLFISEEARRAIYALPNEDRKAIDPKGVE